MARLYSSPFSTIDYFRLVDRARDMQLCVQDDPRHLICFRRRGATIEVLNKVFDIDPDSVCRLCTALFRAHRGALRIRIEVKTVPRDIPAPLRVLYWADDQVIDPPPSTEAYRQSIGRTTRKHLQQYSNKLHREHPDFTCERIPGSDVDDELLQALIGWNVERMDRKGVRSVFLTEPERVDYTLGLAHTMGVATVCRIAGRPAAAYITFDVGDEAWVFTGAFDSAYERDHLGLLAMYLTIADAIDRGARRVHLLWGSTTYKERLGARPERAWRICVYRYSWIRFFCLCELGGVLRHRWRAHSPYWAARHAAKRVLERATRAGRPPAGD
jgi:hypothetical protein